MGHVEAKHYERIFNAAHSQGVASRQETITPVLHSTCEVKPPELLQQAPGRLSRGCDLRPLRSQKGSGRQSPAFLEAGLSIHNKLGHCKGIPWKLHTHAAAYMQMMAQIASAFICIFAGPLM